MITPDKVLPVSPKDTKLMQKATQQLLQRPELQALAVAVGEFFIEVNDTGEITSVRIPLGAAVEKAKELVWSVEPTRPKTKRGRR